MTDNTGLARQWLEGLAARGITITERNGRLRIDPERAYSTLPDADVLFLRHHRADVRDALRAGPPVQASALTLSENGEPTPELAQVAPTRCPYCHRPQEDCDTLRNERPDVWELVCSAHPDVANAQRARAMREMLASLQRYGRAEY